MILECVGVSPNDTKSECLQKKELFWLSTLSLTLSTKIFSFEARSFNSYTTTKMNQMKLYD